MIAVAFLAGGLLGMGFGYIAAAFAVAASRPCPWCDEPDPEIYCQ